MSCAFFLTSSPFILRGGVAFLFCFLKCRSSVDFSIFRFFIFPLFLLEKDQCWNSLKVFRRFILIRRGLRKSLGGLGFSHFLYLVFCVIFFSDRMTLMAIGSCRAFIYRGFLTHEECDHLMTLVSFYIAFCVPRGINFGFGYFTVKRYLKK